MIRVAVLGAAGRMGRTVCHAVAADPDLELVVGIDPHGDGPGLAELPELSVSADREDAVAAGAEVAVDFTTPQVVLDNVLWALDRGLHAVVGTTGMTPADHDAIRERLAAAGGRTNVIVAPNFAVGAVLMQAFARRAARWFPAAEVIELHHDGKLDAPSGTAAATARMLAEARAETWSGPAGETVPGVRGGEVEGIRVHSVRLPGLLAHQEVIFGGLGQTLTIRHDSLDRTSFMPGVLLAIRSVSTRPGLTVGIESLLEPG